MNFLPQLSAWQFAMAGCVFAAGPIVIHLLNRRRYRVVEWAAMDFLREALARNRRIMQLRDLLLLLLRTAAVLLFGMALARPFLAARDEQFDGSKPLHAVLVFDNSLSMGYETLGGTLLDRARQRADEYLDRLPPGSRVSVIPLCGSAAGYSPDAYTLDDAREAIGRIEVVDRGGSVPQAMNEARRAVQNGPALAHRVVFFSDQRQQNWRDVSGADVFADLASVQMVDLSPGDVENAWIADLRVQDGLADVETPTTLIAVLRYEGTSPRRDLPVTLSVDGVEVASKTVTLESGSGSREVWFTHVFNGYQPEVGRPALVPVTVSIPPDRLPADDERHLVVPVVAALPVVFVDQFGASGEDVVRGRVGETRHVRKLLAPGSRRGERELVEVRHVTVEQLDRDSLADARLIVIAGVASPPSPDVLRWLREYVEQGGQLVIAAGGEFDPAAWTQVAWFDDQGNAGGGILPCPLAPAAIGSLPTETAGTLRPMFLDYQSLAANEYFQLAGVSEQELRDLYAEPLFFKAVASQVDEATGATLRAAERERLHTLAEFLTTSAQRRTEFARQESQGTISADQQRQQREDELRLESLEPHWLAWRPAEPSDVEILQSVEEDDLPRRIETLVERTMPRVLARLSDRDSTPYLVERRMGRGSVTLVASGLYSHWNTLPRTNAFLVFDRILRSRIRDTLPERNFEPRDQIDLPLPSDERNVSVALYRPGKPDSPEVLDTGFIGRSRRGVIVDKPLARGLYRVVATQADEDAPLAGSAVWEVPLTVHGDADQSELTPLAQASFAERVGDANVQWIAEGEEISLAGSQIRAQSAWWWLVLLVLGLLLFEMTVLAAPRWRQPQAEAI